jgi:hypothetical protein
MSIGGPQSVERRARFERIPEKTGLCYIGRMKRRAPQRKAIRRTARRRFAIGRERFAQISAIEGIELTREASERAAEFDRLGLSPQERIRRIVAVHRKG